MSPDNFTPQTAFEGYVYAKLENVEKKIEDLLCNKQCERIGKVENEISNIKGKATVIGTIAGFVSAVITKYILGK